MVTTYGLSFVCSLMWLVEGVRGCLVHCLFCTGQQRVLCSSSAQLIQTDKQPESLASIAE